MKLNLGRAHHLFVPALSHLYVPISSFTPSNSRLLFSFRPLPTAHRDLPAAIPLLALPCGFFPLSTSRHFFLSDDCRSFHPLTY